MSLPHCPQCNSEYTYEDNGMFICPECAHEWNDAEPAQESDELIRVREKELIYRVIAR